MHVVVWISKGQRYAMPSTAIVEVIPVVQARPIAGSEAWLSGLFNYRGDLLPLMVWSLLLGADAGDVSMASRILVVQRGGSSEDPQLCGLLVEHVLGTEQIECEAGSTRSPAASPQHGFLGPVVLTASGTVQLTVPSRLPAVE